MDGNYEWQRFRANERLQARRREAAAQRLLRPARPGRVPRRLLAWRRVKAAWLALRSRKRADRSPVAQRERLI